MRWPPDGWKRHPRRWGVGWSGRPARAKPTTSRRRIAWARNDLTTLRAELKEASALGCPRKLWTGLQGLVLFRANQLSEAEPLLREAFEDGDRTDPDVADALARIYLGSFRLTEAGTVLDRWSREVPDDARPYVLRPEIDGRMKTEPELMIASYRAALERDPALDRARLGLAEQLLANHHNAEAAAEYAIYLGRKPDDLLGYLGRGAERPRDGR